MLSTGRKSTGGRRHDPSWTGIPAQVRGGERTILRESLSTGWPRLQARAARWLSDRASSHQALERALERVRQEQGLVETPTLAEFVEIYLAQHDTEPETIEKLRWLLSKATARFGDLPSNELAPADIAAWRMTIPHGHRFEATQALRQTLQRAVHRRMINTNPAGISTFELSRYMGASLTMIDRHYGT